MKTLIITALAAFALAGSAFAESSAIRIGSALGDRGQTVALTNAIPASTTESTHVGSGVDLREWENVSLQTSFNSGSAGTGTVTLTFARSGGRLGPADSGIVYETTPRFTWVLAANGTNTVVGHTNLPRDSISGAAALRLVSVAAGTNALANFTLTVTRKR